MTKTAQPRRDIHQEVTDRIIAALERGVDSTDFEMPWVAMAHQGRPVNATTAKAYNGINILLLWSEAQDKGYSSNEWAGFKQWKTRRAAIRKGERGSLVVFVKPLPMKDDQGEPRLDSHGKPMFFPMVKWSHVWNAAQVDGYESETATAELPDLAERLDRCDAFVAATGARVDWTEGSAFYTHAPQDRIGMPPREAFKDTQHSTATERLYSTLFHELTHWTGATHRLARPRFEKGNMQSRHITERAKEELIAELGAAFLCAEHGIEDSPRDDHAGYIASWLTALKNDKKFIFSAAGKASEAANYLAELQQPAAAAA